MDLPFAREALAALFQKSRCGRNPGKTGEAAPDDGGYIVFHADKCVNCMRCERVCAVKAITHEIEKTGEGERVTRSFQLDACIFCDVCRDFCDHGAIEITGIETKEASRIVSGSFLKKPPAKKPKPAAGKAKTEKKPPATPRADGKPVQNAKACVYCTICARRCPAGALAVDREAKRWTLDEALCVGCGNCAGVCPKQCIIIKTT